MRSAGSHSVTLKNYSVSTADASNVSAPAKWTIDGKNRDTPTIKVGVSQILPSVVHLTGTESLLTSAVETE